MVTIKVKFVVWHNLCGAIIGSTPREPIFEKNDSKEGSFFEGTETSLYNNWEDVNREVSTIIKKAREYYSTKKNLDQTKPKDTSVDIY